MTGPVTDPGAPPVAVLTGGPDDVEIVAALVAVSALTGSGPVGRHLAGVGPPRAATPAPDPWTTRGRAVAGSPRRTHRWSRVTSHRP